MKKFCLIFLVFTLMTLFGISKTLAAKSPAETLYKQLGGLPAISVVVDDFINRIVDDNRINKENPYVAAARKRVPAPYLKYQVTALVCQATGGPCKYTGKSMYESHKNLHITNKDWGYMLDDFGASLSKYKVPESLQKQLFAIVASTKKDIVLK